MNAGEAEAALTEWKRRRDQDAGERNRLIRAAHAAGVSIRQIHLRSGVSRTTIYRVLDAAPGAGEGTGTATGPPRQPDRKDTPAP